MDAQDDLITQARLLYWQSYDVPYIAKHLGVSTNTVYSWRRREKWDEASSLQRVRESTHIRYLRLIAKDPPSPSDIKIIDLLGRQLERFKKHDDDEGGGQKAGKKLKNWFTEEQIAKLRTVVDGSLYEHQKRWFKQRKRRNRFILKSRQIGATWFFAREALLHAIDTGNNQIFLSASRAQAYQFKYFIIALAREVGVELRGGDTIILGNGAIIYFLGTAAAHAQSYTGDLYMDEVFWIRDFIEIRKVAAGMATHTGLRRTYISTASSEEHQAFEFWTGEHFNKDRRRNDRIELDVSHKALKKGKLCADNIWRQIVTLDDAIRLGFDRIDQEEIRNENSPDEYENMYNCVFIKAGERAFDYNAILNCAVDGYMPNAWSDWHPFAPRPLGEREVWIGYDPNGSSGMGDSGGLVVIAPPMVAGGKFRCIERRQMRGLEYEQQAAVIEDVCSRYNVSHIAIDGTGIGSAVWQLVKKFFPAAVMYNYSPVLKREMVLKMQMVIRAGRFEYDAGMIEIARSFMTVRKVTTGAVITYESDRARGSNHGDLAWATMQCIYHEPIGADVGGPNNGFVEEF